MWAYLIYACVVGDSFRIVVGPDGSLSSADENPQWEDAHKVAAELLDQGKTILEEHGASAAEYYGMREESFVEDPTWIWDPTNGTGGDPTGPTWTRPQKWSRFPGEIPMTPSELMINYQPFAMSRGYTEDTCISGFPYNITVDRDGKPTEWAPCKRYFPYQHCNADDDPSWKFSPGQGRCFKKNDIKYCTKRKDWCETGPFAIKTCDIREKIEAPDSATDGNGQMLNGKGWESKGLPAWDDLSAKEKNCIFAMKGTRNRDHADSRTGATAPNSNPRYGGVPIGRKNILKSCPYYDPDGLAANGGTKPGKARRRDFRNWGMQRAVKHGIKFYGTIWGEVRKGCKVNAWGSSDLCRSDAAYRWVYLTNTNSRSGTEIAGVPDYDAAIATQQTLSTLEPLLVPRRRSQWITYKLGTCKINSPPRRRWTSPPRRRDNIPPPRRRGIANPSWNSPPPRRRRTPFSIITGQVKVTCTDWSWTDPDCKSGTSSTARGTCSGQVSDGSCNNGVWDEGPNSASGSSKLPCSQKGPESNPTLNRRWRSEAETIDGRSGDSSNRRRRVNMLSFELERKPSLECVIADANGAFPNCRNRQRTTDSAAAHGSVAAQGTESRTTWTFKGTSPTTGNVRDGDSTTPLYSPEGYTDDQATMSWRELVEENPGIAGYTKSGGGRGWDAIITEENLVCPLWRWKKHDDSCWEWGVHDCGGHWDKCSPTGQEHCHAGRNRCGPWADQSCCGCGRRRDTSSSRRRTGEAASSAPTSNVLDDTTGLEDDDQTRPDVPDPPRRRNRNSPPRRRRTLIPNNEFQNRPELYCMTRQEFCEYDRTNNVDHHAWSPRCNFNSSWNVALDRPSNEADGCWKAEKCRKGDTYGAEQVQPSDEPDTVLRGKTACEGILDDNVTYIYEFIDDCTYRDYGTTWVDTTGGTDEMRLWNNMICDDWKNLGDQICYHDGPGRCAPECCNSWVDPYAGSCYDSGSALIFAHKNLGRIHPWSLSSYAPGDPYVVGWCESLITCGISPIGSTEKIKSCKTVRTYGYYTPKESCWGQPQTRAEWARDLLRPCKEYRRLVETFSKDQIMTPCMYHSVRMSCAESCGRMTPQDCDRETCTGWDISCKTTESLPSDLSWGGLAVWR